MARPRKKMLDPAWQEARKRDRHKGRKGVVVHLDEAVHAEWLAAANSEGYVSIPAWVQAVVTRYIREEGSHHDQA